jgi:hypothetical protein
MNGLPAHQNILDAANLVFRGVDFRPLSAYTGGKEPPEVIQGSVRIECGYDPTQGCSVEVIEFVGLLRNGDGEPVNDHRLAVIWDDGENEEILLDHGEVLFDINAVDDAMKSQAARREKIMQGLLAIMKDEL